MLRKLFAFPRTLAELVRSAATSGGGAVVLSAGTVPFVRSRARNGLDSVDPASGGALEIAAREVGGTLIVTDAGDGAIQQSDLAAELGEALRSAGAGDLVLATAARHDLVAEAGGGAEPGTAVTPAAPIDVAAASDDDAVAEGQDTFTLVTAV